MTETDGVRSGKLQRITRLKTNLLLRLRKGLKGLQVAAKEKPHSQNFSFIQTQQQFDFASIFASFPQVE